MNEAVSWILRTFGGVTTAITNVTVKYALDPLRSLLTDVPWWMVAGFAALIGWRVSRRWGLTVLAFVCITAVGVLGMWNESMDTLSQVHGGGRRVCCTRDPARDLVARAAMGWSGRSVRSST